MDSQQGKPTLESLAAAVDDAQSNYQRCLTVLESLQQQVTASSAEVGKAQAAVAEALQALKDRVSSGV